VSLTGLRRARPNRSSNRLEPTLTATVRPSAGISGPSTSLSDGGWRTPRIGWRTTGRDEVARRGLGGPACRPQRGQHTGLMCTVEWV
jgi:hypothetical protein